MNHLRTTTTVSLTVGELMLIVSLLGNTDPDDERHMVNDMLSGYPQFKMGVQWPAHRDKTDLLRSEAFDAIKARPGIYETMIKLLKELQYQPIVAGWREEF